MDCTYDARDVANFVLDRCDVLGRDISNLSLQKIVFFCHAMCLASLRRPLIKESFEAWPRGPVMPYLYREFKDFGDQPIRKRATKLNRETGNREVTSYQFDKRLLELLTDTVDSYSQLNAYQLMEMSHVAGGPWEQVWNHNKKINAGMRISDGSISEFYSPKLGNS